MRLRWGGVMIIYQNMDDAGRLQQAAYLAGSFREIIDVIESISGDDCVKKCIWQRNVFRLCIQEVYILFEQREREPDLHIFIHEMIDAITFTIVKNKECWKGAGPNICYALPKEGVGTECEILQVRGMGRFGVDECQQRVGCFIIMINANGRIRKRKQIRLFTPVPLSY